ncbi:unnamed protein product [Darwinula stevensoni]|uniref:Uncharacterized protein n=1 Tax=Darwinula stevensoni TaxID=69355 RepID=A0A7R9FP23_9CRUS|nr:unnamed protein product [Darwinula stevensoni]CAG0897367.1 unnamed protein product [Darwinula stevensoni]
MTLRDGFSIDLIQFRADNNPITEVEHGFFENFKNLWHFSCNNCNLGPTLFNGTLEFHSEALRYVSLGGNNISSLESHAITGFTAETRIELWGNEIRNFTKEFFVLMLENLSAGEGYIDLYENLSSSSSTYYATPLRAQQIRRTRMETFQR